jgi:4,5-DOPA dioxygenase extradiol
MEQPRTIYDFYGFPQELYEKRYPAPGSPELAKMTVETLRESHVGLDSERGLDHGSWAVLCQMYPKADVPVVQLSLDQRKQPALHYELGRELRALRRKGVLIIGSGNIVHNLMAIAPGAPPYDWALSYDAEGARKIEARDAIGFADIIGAGRVAKLANPTPEHVLPTLYALGVADEKDDLKFFNLGFDLGSLSMRSFVLS